MSKRDKIYKLAQEVYLIPPIRRYLLTADEVSRVKLSGMVRKYFKITNGDVFDKLIDDILFVGQTEKAFTE